MIIFAKTEAFYADVSIYSHEKSPWYGNNNLTFHSTLFCSFVFINIFSQIASFYNSSRLIVYTSIFTCHCALARVGRSVEIVPTRLVYSVHSSHYIRCDTSESIVNKID